MHKGRCLSQTILFCHCLKNHRMYWYRSSIIMKHLGFLLITTFCLVAGQNKDYRCEEYSDECIQVIVRKNTENIQVQCNDVVKYRTCINPGCNFTDISNRVEEIMNREKLHCPEVWDHMCSNMAAVEKCDTTFDVSLVDLDLTEHTEMKCRLAQGLMRCLEKKGGCLLQATRGTLHRALGRTDCSEYLDLCNRTVEENCSMIYAISKKNRCEKLKDLKECLRTQSSCPQGHIHFTMRKVMQEGSFDCSDIDACNQIKQESCTTDAFANLTDTKENQCKRFRRFKSCIVAAQCNDLYRDFKISKVDKMLNSPCDGTSVMLASIGLTLLLAVFTSLWK